MNDLKMTQLCGKAMDYEIVQRSARRSHGWWCVELAKHYDPLHDDAQAMALVKRFSDVWVTRHQGQWRFQLPGHQETNADLNRAIVECIAKMQQAKP